MPTEANKGATPQPGATPGQQTPTPGATPAEGAQPEALLSALKKERDTNRALEKERADALNRLTAAEGELSTYRRRDAVEKAIDEAAKLRKDAKLPAEFDRAKVTAHLARVSLEDLPAAAKDLLELVCGANPAAPAQRVINGQPPSAEIGGGRSSEPTQYEKRRAAFLAMGQAGLDLTRQGPPKPKSSPFGRR